jgi:hypothetical protein
MLLVAILSGTATSQLPEFAQQYRQRIGGAVDALKEVMADFETDAAAFGLSVDEAIHRLKSDGDGFTRQRGESMAQTQVRLDRLAAQQVDMQSAGPFARLGVFLKNMDKELAQATAEDYEPALPVTIEGLAAAGLGGLAGLLLVRFLLMVGRLGRRRSAA